MTNLVDRLERHIARLPMSGCWVWLGAVDSEGYARINVGGENCKAHRISFREHVGEIPGGRQLDHLCRVKCCVNPSHLEPVTQAENIRRGDVARGMQRKKAKACKRGHVFTEGSFYVARKRAAGGGFTMDRKCKECVRMRKGGLL